MGLSGRNIHFKLSFKWSQLRSLSTVSNVQQPCTTNKQNHRNLEVSNFYLNGHTLRFHPQTCFVPFYWSEKLQSLAMRAQESWEYTKLIKKNAMPPAKKFQYGRHCYRWEKLLAFYCFLSNDRRGDSNFLLLTFPLYPAVLFPQRWPKMALKFVKNSRTEQMLSNSSISWCFKRSSLKTWLVLLFIN